MLLHVQWGVEETAIRPERPGYSAGTKHLAELRWPFKLGPAALHQPSLLHFHKMAVAAQSDWQEKTVRYSESENNGGRIVWVTFWGNPSPALLLNPWTVDGEPNVSLACCA
jgi:hypothetical protein